jgi:hypothetical protein
MVIVHPDFLLRASDDEEEIFKQYDIEHKAQILDLETYVCQL